MTLSVRARIQESLKRTQRDVASAALAMDGCSGEGEVAMWQQYLTALQGAELTLSLLNGKVTQNVQR